MQETILKPMHCHISGKYLKKNKFVFMYCCIDSVGSVMLVGRSLRHKETHAKALNLLGPLSIASQIFCIGD